KTSEPARSIAELVSTNEAPGDARDVHLYLKRLEGTADAIRARKRSDDRSHLSRLRIRTRVGARSARRNRLDNRNVQSILSNLERGELGCRSVVGWVRASR